MTQQELRVSIDRGWNWWRIHWEPITAVVSLVFSLTGIWIATAGLEAANTGIKLAHRTAMLERAPVMKLAMDQPTISITLSNEGQGPSDVYQVDLFYDGNHTNLWSNGNPADIGSALNSFFRQVFTELGLNDAPLAYRLSSPTLIYRAGQATTFFSFDRRIVDKYPVLKTIFQKLTIGVCYMDLSGENKNFTIFGSKSLMSKSDCRKDPVPFIDFSEAENLSGA